MNVSVHGPLCSEGEFLPYTQHSGGKRWILYDTEQAKSTVLYISEALELPNYVAGCFCCFVLFFSLVNVSLQEQSCIMWNLWVKIQGSPTSSYIILQNINSVVSY